MREALPAQGRRPVVRIEAVRVLARRSAALALLEPDRTRPPTKAFRAPTVPVFTRTVAGPSGARAGDALTSPGPATLLATGNY
jgi:hypothetical protein